MINGKILGCGNFDSEHSELMRSCGDILFSNKIWICKECSKKDYNVKERKIIDFNGV